LKSVRSALAVILVVLGLLALPAAASAGTVLADNGFRPNPNGFSFQNYGAEEGYLNLDAGQMQRIYGSGVCLSGGGAKCALTPVAQAYMDAFNAASSGGHCFGFATLSELIYKGYLPRFGYSAVSAFGAGAQTTFALGIEGNDLLQRSISRAFIFQALPALSENTIAGTPRQILHELLHGKLDPKSKEIWTFTIFQYGHKAGHAITPYAVEDMGNGIYDVAVYDNNWPDDANRRLEINTKKNTWSYYAMISPGYPQAQYEGNAKSKSLSLVPVTPALGVQPCPFCVGRQGGHSKFNEVRLDGTGSEHARFLITDARGRQTGFKDGRFVNRIPGAKVLQRTSGGYRLHPGGQLFADSPAPVVRLPKGAEFEISVDGRHLKRRDRETLSLVGPTYDAVVENLIMGPGQSAEVALSPHGNAIGYRPSAQTVSPAISLGAQTKQVGYRVTVAGVRAPKGTDLIFVKRPQQKLMWFGDTTTKRRVYKLTIARLGNRPGLEPETFTRTVAISGRQQAFFYYGPLSKPKGTGKIVIVTPGRKHHEVKVIPIDSEGPAS
jgi:hypothetical protein